MLLSNGDGTTASPGQCDTKGIGPDGIAAADLNPDGKLDLVVANDFQGPSIHFTHDQVESEVAKGEAEGRPAKL